MLNGTNLVGKDKLRAPAGNPSETLKLLAAAAGHLSVPLGKPARRRLPAWFRSLPDRSGAWLYRRNDTEAGWWHWQITELRGGLVRSYRDVRFDVLRQLCELTPELTPESTQS